MSGFADWNLGGVGRRRYFDHIAAGASTKVYFVLGPKMALVVNAWS